MQPRSQVSADGRSGSTPAGGSCNGNANLTHGANDSSKNDSASPSTTISEPSVSTTRHKLMHLSEVLLASLSVLPGRNVALATSGTYSQPLSNWSAKYDPATCSWNKSQLSLPMMEGEPLADTSQDWPRSGLIVSGTAYPLAPLVRIISEIGSGLWPTMLARDQHTIAKVKRGANSPGGTPLSVAAAMWPTPSGPAGGQTSRGGKRKGELLLGGAVKMWPPVAAGDSHIAAPNQNTSSLGRSLRRQTDSGSLNPTWVEWLMGFPLGHTVLKDSATQSSRKSPTSSGKQSTKSKQQQQQHDNNKDTTIIPPFN